MERMFGFLREDALLLDMKSTTKDEAIRELARVVVDHGELAEGDKEAAIEAIMKREAQGSTGLGDGIAIPHVKDSPLVQGLTGAFGRHPNGVEFSAVDGNPVDLIFLILGGEGTSQDHIKVLRGLASLRQNPHFLRFLRDAVDEEAVLDIIKEMSGSLT